MEKNQNRIDATLKEMQRKGRPAQIREPPGCFPFTVLDDLFNFKDVDQQTYDNVVNHFIYLGGVNPTDSAGHYFKCAFGDNEEISSHITWLGTKFQHALKGTRFTEACEDAMAQNMNYRRPGNKEFGDAMSRALKSMKERRRKHLLANAINQRPQRDLTNNDDEDVQPVRRRLENASPIRDNDEFPQAIDETEGHSEVDKQQPYEESSQEESSQEESSQEDYEEYKQDEPLNEEDYYILNEGIAEQQQAREDDFLDYSLTEQK